METRIIVHCDLDAFYAAVETLHHGFEKSIPLIIGSDPENGRGRGIVSTCNYAARKFGIKSAMAISEAWRRCPGHPYGNAIYADLIKEKLIKFGHSEQEAEILIMKMYYLIKDLIKESRGIEKSND